MRVTTLCVLLLSVLTGCVGAGAPSTAPSASASALSREDTCRKLNDDTGAGGIPVAGLNGGDKIQLDGILSSLDKASKELTDLAAESGDAELRQALLEAAKQLTEARTALVATDGDAEKVRNVLQAAANSEAGYKLDELCPAE